LREIQEIQSELGRNNPLASDLNRIAGDIRSLMRDPRLGDPQAIEKLAQQIIDPFKSVELELSRTLELLLAKENVRSAQEEEIPAGYKKLVEEYYKKLSNTKP